MKKLVLASNNAKKMKELNALLAPLGFEVIPQGQLGIPEAEEPHCTFVRMRWPRPAMLQSCPACRRWQTIPGCVSQPSAAPPVFIPHAMPANQNRMHATTKNCSSNSPTRPTAAPISFR